MAKNEQSLEVNQPVWFDGKSINEALFCDDFLSRHKIIYTNGAYGWSDSVSNLSGKLQRESLRYREVVELADVLGYDLVWQKRRD